MNEAVNNKMMHYAGVMTEASEPAPEEARVIQFPKGKYLMVKGEGMTSDELNNKVKLPSVGIFSHPPLIVS